MKVRFGWPTMILLGAVGGLVAVGGLLYTRNAGRTNQVALAQSAVPALQRSLDAARANEGQVDARFKAGLATAVELADAEALLTDADIQLAIGTFQLSRARAVLARATAEVLP